MTSDFWHVITEYRYASPAGAEGTPPGGNGIFNLGLLYTFD